MTFLLANFSCGLVKGRAGKQVTEKVSRVSRKTVKSLHEGTMRRIVSCEVAVDLTIETLIKIKSEGNGWKNRKIREKYFTMLI